VDVDAICDGQQVFIGGIMEHIEQQACILAILLVHCHASLSQTMQNDIIDQMTKLALV